MHTPTNCLNCGAAVANSYCSVCGQETTLHVPSAAEFIHEFIGHYVALEGKLWRTLKLLVAKPGMLTKEYLEGRRARYVLPLRLFLTFSILFFAVLKFQGTPVAQFDDKEAQTRPHAAAPADATLGPDRQFQHWIEQNLPKVAAKWKQYEAAPPAEQQHLARAAFFSYTPYAMFLLMPVFALYLKLLYLGSGRRYGEHLLFALHTNAFAYLLITVAMLLPSGLLTFCAICWLLAYLPLAMRRVYGGKRFATVLRWIVLALLHGVSVLLALLGAIGVGVLA